MELFEELFERSKSVTPGGVHSPVRAFKDLEQAPLFFKSGEGAHMTDQKDKSYIDLCSSFGPLILGHRDREVQNDIQEILNNAWSFGAPESYSLELAEWIIGEVPWIERLDLLTLELKQS